MSGKNRTKGIWVAIPCCTISILYTHLTNRELAGELTENRGSTRRHDSMGPVKKRLDERLVPRLRKRIVWQPYMERKEGGILLKNPMENGNVCKIEKTGERSGYLLG